VSATARLVVPLEAAALVIALLLPTGAWAASPAVTPVATSAATPAVSQAADATAPQATDASSADTTTTTEIDGPDIGLGSIGLLVILVTAVLIVTSRRRPGRPSR